MILNFYEGLDNDLKFYKHVLELYSKVNQKLRVLSKKENFFHSIKETQRKARLWSLSSNIVPLFGYFIVDIPTAKLIDYIKEPLKFFKITTIWPITL